MEECERRSRRLAVSQQFLNMPFRLRTSRILYIGTIFAAPIPLATALPLWQPWPTTPPATLFHNLPITSHLLAAALPIAQLTEPLTCDSQSLTKCSR